MICALVLATPGGIEARPQSAPLDVWSAVSAAPGVREVGAAWSTSRGASSPVGLRVRADATSRIVPQLEAGAPADVLVTADRAWMDRAIELGVVSAGTARRIASNRLVLFERVDGATSGSGAGMPSAPAPTLVATGVAATLADLGARVRAGPLLALASPDVPLGRRSREVLSAAEVEGVRSVSLGSARAVLGTVALGEVPYGIGYATDVLAEPDLRVIARIAPELHTPAEVWAGPVATSDRPEAGAFVAELAGVRGRDVFTALGFDVGDVPALRVGAVERAAEAPLPPLREVVGRSVAIGLLAVLLSTLPAIALGRWLARSRSSMRAPVGTALLLPLVLPPVVTGFVLLALLGSAGPIGSAFGALGVRLSFTFWAAVVAAAVVGFPLYVVVARNAFEAVDPRYEELAWTLGAKPRRTLWRVVLPLALPGIVAGAVLALARGLGEFGATIVVAGNIEGETQTIALAVYQLLESPTGRERIWLYVGASVAIAALALATWEWLSARQRSRLLDGGRG